MDGCTLLLVTSFPASTVPFLWGFAICKASGTRIDRLSDILDRRWFPNCPVSLSRQRKHDIATHRQRLSSLDSRGQNVSWIISVWNVIVPSLVDLSPICGSGVEASIRALILSSANDCHGFMKIDKWQSYRISKGLFLWKEGGSVFSGYCISGWML